MRIVTIFPLGLVLVLILAACGGSDTATTGDPSTTETSTDETSTTTTETSTTSDATTATTGADATTTSADATGSTADPPADGTGIIAVQLEEIEGFFIEGFEVGLRFEDSDGLVIDATLWSEVVAAQPDDNIDAYYTAVHEQEVPAGPVTVLASVSIGAGPGPETPDLRGELDCQLEVNVAENGRAEVEVAFTAENCLREL